jgi:hypothetical protein
MVLHITEFKNSIRPELFLLNCLLSLPPHLLNAKYLQEGLVFMNVYKHKLHSSDLLCGFDTKYTTLSHNWEIRDFIQKLITRYVLNILITSLL